MIHVIPEPRSGDHTDYEISSFHQESGYDDFDVVKTGVGAVQQSG